MTMTMTMIGQWWRRPDGEELPFQEDRNITPVYSSSNIYPPFWLLNPPNLGSKSLKGRLQCRVGSASAPRSKYLKLGTSSAIISCVTQEEASHVALEVKSLPAGNIRDADSNPRLGRSSGGGRGNPLQYTCLENPTDRGAWRATGHGVAKGWTWLMWLSTHAHTWPRKRYSDLSESRYRHLENLANNCAQLPECLWGLNKLIHGSQ